MTTASASLLIDLTPRHLVESTEEAADLGTRAVLADQPLDGEHGLSARQHEQVRQALRRSAAGSRAPLRAATGPRGCQIGDVIVADGSDWRVVAPDPRVGRTRWEPKCAAGREEAVMSAASEDQLSLLEGPAARGPRGCRVDDVVVAERSRWRVVAIDQARHEAVCSLIAGAWVLHRFRARQITRVERQPSLAAVRAASTSAAVAARSKELG